MKGNGERSRGGITRRVASSMIAATLAQVLATPPLVGAAFAQAGKITVGVVLPMTGVLAAYGKPFADAMRMVVDEVNAAGGVDGRQIELLIEDGQASNTAVVNALNKILQSDPVAMIGPALGTQVLAMMPITERQKLPLIAGPGTRRVSQMGAKYYVRNSVHDAFAKENTVRFLVGDLGKKRVGIMHVGNEWGYSGRDNVTAYLESLYQLKPVSIAAYQATDKDLTAQIMQMQRDGADAIVVQGHPVDEVLAVRQMRQLGISQVVVGSSALAIAYLRDLADPAEFVGRYCEAAAMIPPFSTDSRTQAVVAAYQKKTGFAPDISTIMYYDAAGMLIEVMRKYGTTREKINEGLRQISYDGLLGKYKSDEEGNLLRSTLIIEFGPDKALKVVRDGSR